MVGAASGLAASAVVHTFWASFPFPPISVAELIARRTPGGVASFFIDLLQHSALPLTVVAAAAGLAVISAGLGALMPRVAPRAPGGALGAAGLLAAPVYAFTVGVMQPDAVTVGRSTYGFVLIPVFALSAWVTARTFERLRTAAPAVSPAEDPTRRTFLLAAGVGGGGLALGWLQIGRILFPRPNPGRLTLHLANLTRATLTAGDPSFDLVPGITPRVTPNAKHYVVDEEIIDPDVDPANWRLRINGSVARPYELTYDEMMALPAVEQYQTLECISNPVGGDLISTARWAGIPLREILDRAGVRPGAVEVVSHAIGGYADSIPLGVAMHPTTLIAVGMNGKVLPREHGFPARLLVPGLYGMKQPKWLEQIEVVDRPFIGYWEQRGWIKAAVVKTMSRLDGGGRVDGELVLGGVAFAGERGVSKVEISADERRSWEEAQLEAALSVFTWRRWRFPVPNPPTGAAEYVVRATDGSGGLQIASITPTHPSGATGYDRGLVSA